MREKGEGVSGRGKITKPEKIAGHEHLLKIKGGRKNTVGQKRAVPQARKGNTTSKKDNENRYISLEKEKQKGDYGRVDKAQKVEAQKKKDKDLLSGGVLTHTIVYGRGSGTAKKQC